MPRACLAKSRATGMARESFGVAGKDVRIGLKILVRAALSEEFAQVSGQYYDNDMGRCAAPHADALDANKCEAVVNAMAAVIGGEKPRDCFQE